MGRLIDEDKLLAELDARSTNPNYRLNMRVIKAMVKRQPEARNVATWLRMSDLSEVEDDRYKCSYCGNIVHHTSRMNLFTFNNWCGRCGRKMEM